LNIIPSKHFLTGNRKEEFIQNYIKEKGAQLCCNGTSASCQFGNECYYQHKQEEESLSRVNESHFLYYNEVTSFANVNESNTAHPFWNSTDIIHEGPLDTDLGLVTPIPHDDEGPNMLKSVMDALAFAKLHEDSLDVEHSLPSWLR
jgi:hypothetical protein